MARLFGFCVHLIKTDTTAALYVHLMARNLQNHPIKKPHKGLFLTGRVAVVAAKIACNWAALPLTICLPSEWLTPWLDHLIGVDDGSSLWQFHGHGKE